MNLSTLLRNTRWTHRGAPFPHFVALDVFDRSYYREQVAAFGDLLARGLADRPDGMRFCRSVSGYDAYVLGFRRDIPAPFHIFLSRPWHDLIARVSGVTATGDLDGGFHHHVPNSSNGWCHSDLNPGWFAGQAASHDVNLSDASLCEYATGRPTRTGIRPREVVRGATMIFYLGDDGWSPGDGGETGLYGAPDQPVERPDAVVPPVGNSLLIFECTPWSYHAFLSNTKRVRSSVILWVHRERGDAVSRWGSQAIVPFRPRANGGRRQCKR
jgi:hypothetical protein